MVCLSHIFLKKKSFITFRLAIYDAYSKRMTKTPLSSDDLPRKRPTHIYKPPTPEMLAYLDFSVSTTGMLTGVKVQFSYL